ncbi:MAG: hypothetical protein RMJ98_03320 [Myxococcales bacterium]|nr:hypothetical protein [Polyangiaceae bacterium]MDW8248321.1 hypothetical protein [Myxococcales bacterium]
MNPPAHGIRFELLRQDTSPPRYRVELRGPEMTWSGEATVSLEDGTISLAPFVPCEPPAWAVSILRAFLRSEWRSRRDSTETPWPTRITRWRSER